MFFVGSVLHITVRHGLKIKLLHSAFVLPVLHKAKYCNGYNDHDDEEGDDGNRRGNGCHSRATQWAGGRSCNRTMKEAVKQVKKKLICLDLKMEGVAHTL